MGERCTGHCCRKFNIGIPYVELGLNFEAFLSGRDFVYQDVGLGQKPMLRDIEIIYPMLVQLPDERPGYYTCKHLQANNDCAIYESRPHMCSDYPYGRACTFQDCTWDEAKNVSAETVRRAPRRSEKLKVLASPSADVAAEGAPA